MSRPARFPFKTLLACGVLSFVLIDPAAPYFRLATDKEMVRQAEFYPLSSFSMYSTYSDSPFTVKVTDGTGQILRFETDLQTHCSETKKTYEAELKKLRKAQKLKMRIMETPAEVKQAAALETLRLLADRPQTRAFLETRADRMLVLHEIILSFDADGHVAAAEREVARL